MVSEAVSSDTRASHKERNMGVEIIGESLSFDEPELTEVIA